MFFQPSHFVVVTWLLRDSVAPRTQSLFRCTDDYACVRVPMCLRRAHNRQGQLVSDVDAMLQGTWVPREEDGEGLAAVLGLRRGATPASAPAVAPALLVSGGRGTGRASVSVGPGGAVAGDSAGGRGGRLVRSALAAALDAGVADPAATLRGLVSTLKLSPSAGAGNHGAQQVLSAVNGHFLNLANLHFALFAGLEGLLAEQKAEQKAGGGDAGEGAGASAGNKERAAAVAALDAGRGPSFDGAWRHLVLGNALELARRPQGRGPVEAQQAAAYIQVFREGFWPAGVGSASEVPIFVVGMMRSGSTLVETVLSSHSAVFGMGEDSVFNGRLPIIRDGVVGSIAASQTSGSLTTLIKAVSTALGQGGRAGHEPPRLMVLAGIYVHKSCYYLWASCTFLLMKHAPALRRTGGRVRCGRGVTDAGQGAGGSARNGDQDRGQDALQLPERGLHPPSLP